MTPFDVLVDRYPRLEDDIRQAEANGASPEEVQASVDRLTTKLRQALNPEQTHAFLTGAGTTAVAPGVVGPAASRTLADVAELGTKSLSLGLAHGKDIPGIGASIEAARTPETEKSPARQWAEFGLENIVGLPAFTKVLGPVGRLATRTLAPEAGPVLKGIVSTGAEMGTLGGAQAAGDVVRGENVTPEDVVSRIILSTVMGGALGAAGGLSARAKLLKAAQSKVDAAAAQAEVEAAARDARLGVGPTKPTTIPDDKFFHDILTGREDLTPEQLAQNIRVAEEAHGLREIPGPKVEPVGMPEVSAVSAPEQPEFTVAQRIEGMREIARQQGNQNAVDAFNKVLQNLKMKGTGETPMPPDALPGFGEPEARANVPVQQKNAEAQVPPGVVPNLPQGRVMPLDLERTQMIVRDALPEIPAPGDTIAQAHAYVGVKPKSPDAADAILNIRGAATNEQTLQATINVIAPELRADRAVQKAIARARAQMAERQLRTSVHGDLLVCASPCEPMYPGRQELSEAAKAKADQDLAIGDVQAAVMNERKGFFGTLKHWQNLLKEGGLWELRSFSEVARATKDPAALETVKLFDQQSRMESKWLSGLSEQANKHLLIKEGSKEDFLVGAILNNPDARNNAAFMAKQTPAVREAVKFLADKWEEMATMRGMKAEEKIPDYFTHSFDARSLRAEAVRFKEMLATGQFPAGLTNETVGQVVKDMDHVIGLVDAGMIDQIRYNQLPQAFKEAFFEHRYGFGGYSLSAVKAFNTYTNFFARKYFWEGYLPQMADLISKVQDPNAKQYAKLLARDLTGLLERQNSPQVEALSANIRNLEFVRTLGSFNVGSSIRNLIGGHMFASVDGGLKNYAKGVNLAFRSIGDKEGPTNYLRMLFENEGHSTDIPIWYAKTADNPITQATRWFAEKSGILFNTVEKGNRRASFYTGLSKWFDTTEGKALGKTLEDTLEMEAVPRDAVNYANDFVMRNQFRYGKADTPWALRGPTAAALFQYATFKIKAMEMLYRWATQEGAAGKMKLASLMALGLGTTYMGDLAGTDFSGNIGTPVDFLSIINAAKNMQKGDLDQARKHIQVGLKNGIFETPMGPISGALEHAGGILQAGLSDQPISKKFWNFAARDLVPSQARAISQAYDDLNAGGDVPMFLERIAGLPNYETRIRLAYLSLLQDGKTEKARELLQYYKQATGGAVPVNFEAVSKARAQATADQLKARLDRLGETMQAKYRRGLPEHIMRLIP